MVLYCFSSEIFEEKQMVNFVNACGHFRTVTHHRVEVMRLCFKAGLYKQGTVHDLSKYSFTEFFSSVPYYDGKSTPIARERADKGYSETWLHHKGHNKHHPEYWVDFSKGQPYPVRMPKKYVAEMACDMISASETYLGENFSQEKPLEFLLSHKPYMHEDSFQDLKKILTIVSDEGIDRGLDYVKTQYLV